MHATSPWVRLGPVAAAMLLAAAGWILIARVASGAARPAVAQSSCGTANRYSTAVRSAGPLVYYRLSDTAGSSACDASGHANTGHYASKGVTYRVPGAVVASGDTAVSARGTANVVQGPAGGVPARSSSFTLEGWWKTTSTHDQLLLEVGTSHPLNIVGMGIWQAGLGGVCTARCFYIDLGSKNVHFTLPAGLNANDGNWHLLDATYASSTAAFTAYVDGRMVGTQKSPKAVKLSGGSVRVGWAYDSRYNKQFNGSLDDVAVYPSALGSAAVAAHFAAATTPQVTAFVSEGPNGINAPGGITRGPDGALWFTNAGNNTIGRITTAGVVTTFTGAGISDPGGITAGPDGALWFTNYSGNAIGRITTAGVVTIYTGTGIDYPTAIAAGPDGALWFTNFGLQPVRSSSIGRITTAGVAQSFTGTGIDFPVSIAAGADGALWFTNFGTTSIGRVTTAGVVSNFAGPSVDQPEGITAGPDGALWFANSGNNTIGRITTAGAMTSFAGAAINDPVGITTGPDGAVWFTNLDDSGNFAGSIGRITTAGVSTKYNDAAISSPLGITVGPDGALWFTNSNNSIGRLSG